MKGLSELGWYYLPRPEPNPFNEGEQSAGIYYLTKNENDLLFARQESLLWKYNDRGELQEYGGVVMDAVRMIASGFRTFGTGLTRYEKREKELSPVAQIEHIRQVADPGLQERLIQTRRIELDRLEQKENERRQQARKYRPNVPRPVVPSRFRR
jgi:hypothetical protein